MILQPILHRKPVRIDLLLCNRWQTSAQGRQKRGGWGGPSRPTFRGKFVIIARVHSLLSVDTPHEYLDARAWLQVCTCSKHKSTYHVLLVNINHVLSSGSWIAGLCEFSSTFVFLSDRDVSSRLPVPAIGDKAHQPSCFRFPQRDFGKTSVVK